MSRSVSTPRNAQVIAYAHVECEEDEADVQDTWDDDLVNLSAALRAAFPSMSPADRWLDREDHVILENRHAYIGVSEYCGLVAVWIVPEDTPTALHWCAQIEPRFRRVVADVFGVELRHIATASNGEAFFERMSA